MRFVDCRISFQTDASVRRYTIRVDATVAFRFTGGVYKRESFRTGAGVRSYTIPIDTLGFAYGKAIEICVQGISWQTCWDASGGFIVVFKIFVAFASVIGDALAVVARGVAGGGQTGVLVLRVEVSVGVALAGIRRDAGAVDAAHAAEGGAVVVLSSVLVAAAAYWLF